MFNKDKQAGLRSLQSVYFGQYMLLKKRETLAQYFRKSVTALVAEPISA